MLNLKGYRSKAKGMSDLLPWAAYIDSGTVLNKFGSVSVVYQYRSLDAFSSVEIELDEVAARFNHALMDDIGSLMLQIDVCRIPERRYPDSRYSHFPDSISQMIEDERREHFENSGTCYRTDQFLTVTYTPPADELKSGSLDRVLYLLKERLDKLEAVLSTIPGFKLERLTDFEVMTEDGKIVRYSPALSHFNQCICHELHPVLLPDVPMYTDAYMGFRNIVGGKRPQVDEQFIKILAIDSLPGESYPAMLSVLDILPMPYRFHTRFIGLDRFEGQRAIEDYRKGWKQKSVNLVDKYLNSPNPRYNMEAIRMVEDADDAKLGVADYEFMVGYYTASVVLLGEDEKLLKQQVKILSSELNALGFMVREETLNTLEAWQGTLPGNSWANPRQILLNTKSLAHLSSLHSVWAGYETCPCPMYPPNSPPLLVCTTDGSTPFRLNLHENDIGHSLIFGPTGSGKSTLLGLIAAQFLRYPNGQIYYFDKGNSILPLTTACGGKHYEIGDENMRFAPFQFLHESDLEFAWALDWLEALYKLQTNQNITPALSGHLSTALQIIRGAPQEGRSMLDFYFALSGNETLQDCFKYYCYLVDDYQGPCGKTWEASRDSFELANFMTFELENIMQKGEKQLLPVLLYLFRLIERRLQGQPSLIVLDEAWIMLGNDVFREKIREWLKVLRKANCAVVLATQSLSDANRSGIMDVLAESCPTKIFLANFSAEQEVQREQYTALGLNERQIQIIRNARPKNDYYVVSPSGRRLVQLALDKKALSFVGVSSKENISRIKELQILHDEAWPEYWLKERNAI